MASELVEPEGRRRRLLDCFERVGLDRFADHEGVRLVLTLAIPRGDVKPLAKAPIAKFGDLHGILDARSGDLGAGKGIGSVTPVALWVIRAVPPLYLQQSAENREILRDPESLYRFWRNAGRVTTFRDLFSHLHYTSSWPCTRRGRICKPKREGS